ncbi:thiolase family protein [Sediminicola luteus]|uniref:acetyl-CoA C-acyltransferase n=1 Tax=Sediminicola luteus TaxID=319238 RepID=A0A2A4GAP5_9FLAO|nr:thiolase family protein [Sediminicola luteus]PCE66029.1 acetyl-CoA acetyltransferase [Sediminicola luteus]
MEAYIVKAYRTAVGKSHRGGFRFHRSDELGAKVVAHMMAEVPQITPEMVDDVIVGCSVPEAEQAFQIGRQVALMSMGIKVPGVTVNRFCASGLEAIDIATAKIRAGRGHCYIAGGAESMSMLPMLGNKYAPSYKVASNTPDYYIGMGNTAEAVAEKYNISREDMDVFATRSHQLAAKAIADGKFKDEIVPISVSETHFSNGKRMTKEFVVDTDEGVRAGTNPEVLAKLRPVFKAGGSVTAGNSSQTSDGASFLLVVSETLVKELNLEPIARMVSCAVAGLDPLYMGVGPIEAIPKALKQAGLQLNDIDLVELNEAFASQALAVIREVGIDPDIVNVNGGAIALGHPLGCTGAKLSTQLFHEMRRRGNKYGMVTACVGGGQGIAGIYELLN